MSKPRIIGQDYGWHANHPNASRARIIKGATWKKARTIVLVPSDEMVRAEVMLSFACIMAPPNQGFYRMLALGDEVGQAYSGAIEQILAHPELSRWEYILTFEHDMVVPADGLLKLVARMEECPQFAAISGLYHTIGEGGVPQCWGDINDGVVNYRPQPAPLPGTVGEFWGLGMGFCLFRLKMFKDERIPRPWFRTKKGADGLGTQDLVFWGEARKHGYRCAVDSNVICGHQDRKTGMIW